MNPITQTSSATAETLDSRELTDLLFETLLTMLQGDRQTADHLVCCFRDAYPERPAQWWYEQAIEVVMRDRR